MYGRISIRPYGLDSGLSGGGAARGGWLGLVAPVELLGLLLGQLRLGCGDRGRGCDGVENERGRADGRDDAPAAGGGSGVSSSSAG